MTVRLALWCLVVFGCGSLFAAGQGLSDSSSTSKSHQRREARLTSVTLIGQVVTEDGRPVPEMVQVELVCNGRSNQQTVTAPDGRFYFEIGSPRSDDWLDPGIGGSSGGNLESVVKVAPPGGSTKLDQVPSMGQGRVSLVGCEVRAAPRAGYSSNSISLRTRDAFENPDIGLIVLRRLSSPQASTVSLSFLRTPQECRDAFEKASRSLEKVPPDLRGAEKELQKALRRDPKFAAAWDLLGRVLMIEGRREEARAAFERAIAEEPGFIQPYLALGRAAIQDSHWEDAWKWSAKLLELDANQPSGLYWRGLSGYHLRRFPEGERALSRLYELGYAEEYPFGWLPLGVIQAGAGRIQAAAASFQKYLALMPADEVTAAQREELGRLLEQWRTQGLLTLSQPPTSPREP
jgi:hypothetical protein